MNTFTDVWRETACRRAETDSEVRRLLEEIQEAMRKLQSVSSELESPPTRPLRKAELLPYRTILRNRVGSRVEKLTLLFAVWPS